MTEAMRIKSLAQGENILMLRFEPTTFVSKIDILTTTPIVHNIIYNYIYNIIETELVLEQILLIYLHILHYIALFLFYLVTYSSIACQKFLETIGKKKVLH